MIYSVKELLTTRGISEPVFVWGILRKKNGDYFLEDVENPDYMLNVSNVKEGGKILLDVLEGVPTVLKYDPKTTGISTIRRLTLEGNKLTFMVNGEYYVIDVPSNIYDKVKSGEEVEEDEEDAYPQSNFEEEDEEEEEKAVEEEIENYYKTLDEGKGREAVAEVDLSEITDKIDELAKKIDSTVKSLEKAVEINKAIKNALEELAEGEDAEEAIEKIVEKKMIAVLKMFSKKEVSPIKAELEGLEIKISELNDEVKKVRSIILAGILLILIEVLFLIFLLAKVVGST